jgi:hypothetical protein
MASAFACRLDIGFTTLVMTIFVSVRPISRGPLRSTIPERAPTGSWQKVGTRFSILTGPKPLLSCQLKERNREAYDSSSGDSTLCERSNDCVLARPSVRQIGMKKLILTALLCASAAYAGLTGTQIKQVMAFADKSGFSFISNQGIYETDDKGQSLTITVLVFYRETDGVYALVDPNLASSLDNAYSQFRGSMLMNEMTQEANRARKATPSSQ